MNKLLVFMLFFFFISGTFATTFTHVSASELVADSWNTKTSMSQARTCRNVVVVNDKIYAIGGQTVENVRTNERYDPKTDTWTTLASIPTTIRYGFSTAVYQNKIYCINAITTEVYDTVTNSWDTKTAIPIDKYSTFACDPQSTSVVNGQIYVMGVSKLRLFMYDIVADEWTEKARVPSNIAFGGGCFFLTSINDDKIVVIGSFWRTADSETENKVLVYDLKTDTWQEVNSAPTLIASEACAGVTTSRYAPQKLYFFRETTTDVYDPVTNKWSTTKTMPTPRSEIRVAVVDDIFYVIGGYTIEPNPDSSPYYPTVLMVYSSVNEQYVPIGYSSTPLTSTPSTTITPTPSDSINPSETLEPFLTDSIVVIIVLTISVAITTSVFFYLRGKKVK
jgi:N-acetylneuraminic acid mutarotase